MEIYYHNDYDGAASAALVSSWWQEYGHTRHEPGFTSVDYNNPAWQRTLPPPNDELVALVDFQWHPRADIWFDHHPTAFATAEQASSYVPTRFRQWAPGTPSCAEQIWQALGPTVPAAWARRHVPLVEHATKIDSARYESVDEYFAARHPAIQISQVWPELGEGQRANIIRRLRAGELELPTDLRPLLERLKRRNNQLLSEYATCADCRDGVVILNTMDRRLPNIRFASFKLYPTARYAVVAFSVGLDACISIGRNPWLTYPDDAPHLGRLAEQFGGGGHPFAAGISFPQSCHDYPAQRATSALYALAATLSNERVSHVDQHQTV